MAKEKIELGLACSPSTITDVQELAVTKFLVSYGGGMGGANQTHYALDYKKTKDYYVLYLLNGNTIEINPRFVVSKQDKKVVRIETDATGHGNYGGKTCKKSILIHHYAMDISDTFTVDKSDYISKMPPSILTEKYKTLL